MEIELGQYNALELAYIGDAVYELFVRHQLLARGSRPMAVHNREAFRMVNAGAQARALHYLSDKLSEKELDMVRYGRNAKGGSAKSASLGEYRLSTGLECLLGYLYLLGDHERVNELMSWIFEYLEREEG